MKAVIYTNYGSPDVLQLKEVEKPTPKNNEVLIKVYAATVNRTDCATLRAKPFFMRLVTGLLKPKRTIPGTDFAGKIEAIGKEVSSFKVGDKIFGFNDEGLSSHTQYMVLSKDDAIITMPSNISYTEATASIEGAHYAYNFINKVNLKAGQWILVNGATGAIGSAAVQLLKHYGAHVTAVCAGKNTDLVKSLGAEKVIDYTNEDFTSNKQEYSCVFDMVGKSSFAKCKPLLEIGGIYISSELGWMYQNLFYSLITPFIGNKVVKFPVPTDIKGSLQLIKKLIEKKEFKPVVDRIYSLDQIADAYRYVEQGQKIGNVVIAIEPDARQ